MLRGRHPQRDGYPARQRLVHHRHRCARQALALYAGEGQGHASAGQILFGGDMTKDEALKLADILEFKIPSISCLEDAAIELRRLHEENVELLGLLTSLVNGSLTVSELSL